MIRSRPVCVVLLSIVAGRAGAQRLTPAQIAHVDSLSAAALRGAPVAGMTVAVARGAAAPWVKGYGLANRERGVRADPTTVYRVRSISKMFAAAAVLQLAAKHLVALDSDVTRYVPDAPTRGRRITVRQLLSHTSGLPNYGGATWRAHYHERLSATEWVHLLDDEPLVFTPGTDYFYSNAGFDLLALLVERVSGESYPGYLERHITGPLGLRAVTHCSEEAPPAGRASPYEPHGGKLVPADAWGDVEYGAAMLCSTAGDLIAWARALDEGKVLDARAVAEMREPTRVADGTPVGYGLGTRLGTLGGHAFAGHSGSGGGWASALVDFPAEHLTIAVLTNTEAESVPKVLALEIARLVLGVPPVVALPTPAQAVAADTGRWVMAGGDSATVLAVDGGLAIRMGSGAPAAPLEYLGGGRFRVVPFPGAELVFLPQDGATSARGRARRLASYADGFFQGLAHAIP
jgi:D-alanyl-D-alanine carboxypeptidase